MKKQTTGTGFTLIELLVVVIIIASLAAMVLPHVMPATTEAKVKIARGDISRIETALSIFRLHHDRYPTTEENLDILLKPSTVKGWNNEPYLMRQPLDPWRRKYQYKCPGSHPPIPYDLWSSGPDGKDSTEDDIANWEK